MYDEWKSVKIREDVYNKLKEMGIGISKAIEILLEEQRKSIEEKFKSIEDISKDIFKIMIKEGFFNIGIKGFSIIDLHEKDDDIVISGMLVLSVPNENVRKKIIEKLKPSGVKSYG